MISFFRTTKKNQILNGKFPSGEECFCYDLELIVLRIFPNFKYGTSVEQIFTEEFLLDFLIRQTGIGMFSLKESKNFE